MLKLPKHKRQLRIRILRELLLWLLILPAAFAVTWVGTYYTNNKVLADSFTIDDLGNLYYADTTNAGVMRVNELTNTTPVFAGQFNGISGSASNIVWIQAQSAPTREEQMIGSLRVNGELQIESCTTDCNANGDYTNQWANAGTTATQDCDAAPGSGTCVRAFDIAYEQLKGRAFVAYADSAADKFYYALWDNSAWSPDSSPASPSTTNEVDFDTGGTGGTPHWIRAVAQGEDFDTTRTNRVMVLVSDSNEDLWACYWDGVSFSCTSSALETILQNCTFGQCFDGAWQDENTFIAVYYDTGASTLRYQKYTVGTGWSGELTTPTPVSLSSAGLWVTALHAAGSTRVLVTTTESGDDTRMTVWRADNSTDGWTTCAITDCPDTGTETAGAPQSAVGWSRLAGTGLQMYNDSANGGDPVDYSKYTPTSTWAAVASTATSGSDDGLSMRARSEPGNNSIVNMKTDVDCDLYFSFWTGNAWNGTAADLSTALSNYGVTCPEQGTPAGGLGINYDFAWNYLKIWQRNWRFYNGTDTASVPTTALAGENMRPTGFNRTNGVFRLRMNYGELSHTNGSSDDRRKLQYTTDCSPNVALESTCTWTDVDNTGGAGIWRYKDITCTPTDCADNTKLTASSGLTGTDVNCAGGDGCGTWIMSKDSATKTNMDLNGTVGGDLIQESEWVVEANGATAGKVYYFRMYDVTYSIPYYRQQDSLACTNNNTVGGNSCTYPSLVTDGINAPSSTDDFMRHGNWFSGGAEQNFFFWADY